MIVEEDIKSEGLLEYGYDWYVQTVELEASSLSSLEFNGVLASWKSKIIKERSQKKAIRKTEIDLNEMTVGQLVSSLKPAQLWSVLVVIASLPAGTFALGVKLIGGG